MSSASDEFVKTGIHDITTKTGGDRRDLVRSDASGSEWQNHRVNSE